MSPHGRKLDNGRSVFVGLARIGEHAQAETIEALRTLVFNWVIWPDFSELPSREKPSVLFKVMNPGDKVKIRDREIEMIPVNHTVPGVGYCLSDGRSNVGFSGDTTTNDTLWEALNRYPQIDLLFVEAAFANSNLEISELSRHYCPRLLGEDILKMKHRPDVWLTHFKPGDEDLIYEECVEAMPDFRVHKLQGGEIFSF